MARKGRRRKDGPRQPNGQPSRAGQGEKIMEVALAQRAKVVGLRANLKDQKLATPMGVLCVLGKLRMANERNDEMALLRHEAGERYVADIGRFRWAHGIPSPHARSADMSDAPKGTGDVEISPEQKRRIAENYRDAWRALEDAGRQALDAVHDVAVHEREPRADQVEPLILGLDSLAVYYGLTRRRKSA